MTDQIPLPPPDHIENVQGFVHDTERRYYSEETMLAHAERLHAARVSSQATQLLASLQTEIDALRHQLQTLAELGNASGDAQILRMGYAAARLEIEHLNTQLQAAREEIKRRDAQEEAIGAGGVEPLRRRECLHKIAEPAAQPAAVWWRQRADEIELEVAQGKSSAMRCYTDMRALLQASAGPEEEPAPAGEYPALPVRTVDELGDYQRQAAIAAFRAGHGHEPDFGFAPDRAWIEGAAYIDAGRAMRAQAAPAAVAGPSLYQVMAVAKAIHATTQDADDWDSLRQWEVDALRRRAEKVLAALAAAPTTPAAPAEQWDAPTDSGPISRQWLTVVYRGVEAGDEVQQICTHPKVSAMSWSHALHDRDAARSQAKQGANHD